MAAPFLLADRSPCTEPFFDPYADPADRRPLISGLCRGRKNFTCGERFVYVTPVHRVVLRQLACQYPHLAFDARDQSQHYFGVAALTVIRVWESHAAAAQDFVPRRYVVDPVCTPYPPNLAHGDPPGGAVSRESCVVYTKNGPHTPRTSTPDDWREQIGAYHALAVKGKQPLRVAECKIERVDGHEALRLNPQCAPLFTAANWGGSQMNVNGIWIDELWAKKLRSRIAQGHPNTF